MKLATLELSGFKSFADYTEFHFDDGITGVVGPNGCGKSNVVDAVKWVLGEMSAKSLRGDGMLDVIFSGSGTRKPMGMAEVSLTFTNEDRKLPMDSETVKITRRLYRDATSEYLINGTMARLKDIRELFLDTGVGVDAYSLIEQGRVAALLDSNSYDRREIFEEAAGISRFKQRKKEALRKLEKTDQNLAQSQLVLDEVEKQLRSVKVQAGRARNYQEYAARLKELRSAYVMQEYDQLHKKEVGLSEQLDGVVDELAAVKRELEGKRTRQQELQIELDSAQDAARKAEREMLEAQSERASAQQRKDFAEQQIKGLSEQRKILLERQGEMGERAAARQAEADGHAKELAGVDGKLREHEAEVAEASFKQEVAAKAIATIQRTIDEHKSRAIDLMRQVSRLHNDINGLKITQESLAGNRARVVQRKAAIDAQIAELKGKVKEGEKRKAELTEASTRLHGEQDGIRVEQQANNKKVAEISQELARVRENRSGLKSRLNVLTDLQAKREGVSQTVREVLKARDAGKGFGYVRAIVADVIETDLAHATAIEAGLGELANALIVSDSGALVGEKEIWQKLAGRVSVLCADRMIAWREGDGAGLEAYTTNGDASAAPSATDNLKVELRTSAAELVRCEGEFSLLVKQLLGNTFVVETLAEAVTLAAAAPREFRFVTRAGEVVEARAAHGVVQLGDMSKRGGMISRRAEVAKLQDELGRVELEVARLTAEIAQGEEASRQLDGKLQELRGQIYQTDSQRAEVNAALQQGMSQLQRTSAEAPLIAGEIESIDRQSGQAAERQKEAEGRVAELEVEQKRVEGVIHEMGAQVILRQHEVSELAEAATRARIAMSQVQEQRAGLSRALATARLAAQQAETELKRIAGEAEAAESRIADATATAGAAGAVLAGLAEKAAAAEAELAGHTEQVGKLRGEQTQIMGGIDGLQEKSEIFGKREHELSLAKNEISVRLETLIEHTAAELEINLHEAYATYEAQSMDWDAVAAEISDLKGKISRLGNVNLDAINEQTTLEQRHVSITGQLADVIEAKRQLEELIGKINEDSKVKFVESFNAVKAEFQEMFRKLFGGGKADLILENPDDILESGIEIMARPPGKEPQSMSLLSGGEKTMTAVALVMSIFKSKPSPFCILDEVDAALDEANTSRFAAIIHEFLAHSQFIVITHNKRTMSVANVLYGVTMQEQGVSKKVAVKFDGKGNATVGGAKVEAPAATAAA